MTILNYPSDGLYPELIVLARTVAQSKSIAREELINLCSAGAGATVRLTAALSRWASLGLFVESNEAISLEKQFSLKRGQTLDTWTDQIPVFCRALALAPANCQPLFGTNVGGSADFVRGMCWLLAQDIFTFPMTWSSKDQTGVEQIELEQIKGEKIIQNDVRWNGLRFWARYLGFASGDARTFLIDPTAAIRAELLQVFNKSKSMPAETFVRELATRLPVLDTGTYRDEVESYLDTSMWRKPAARHLSMSLSYALRRLKLDQVIDLDTRADSVGGYVLTGMSYRSQESFTHVRLIGGAA